MARTKVQIEVAELQDAITQLEAAKLFSSPHKLYEAVAQTPWARALGATPVMVYLRVKEVNVDPDNPVIVMRVKAARKVGPREPKAPGEDRPVKARRAKVTGVAIDGIDLLMEAFRGRGIDVTLVEQLVTSSLNTEDENRAIVLAWADLRDKLGIPKPAKKKGPLASALAAGEVQFTVPPIGDSVVLTEEPVVDSVDSGIVVTEQMPDGSPVETVEPVEPEAAPVVVKAAAPKTLQMTAVRPVVSRPTPVRSPQPPRPMPVAKST